MVAVKAIAIAPPGGRDAVFAAMALPAIKAPKGSFSSLPLALSS